MLIFKRSSLCLNSGWLLAGRGHRVVPHPPEEEGARQADGRVLPVAAAGGGGAGAADRLQRHPHGVLGAQEAGTMNANATRLRGRV